MAHIHIHLPAKTAGQSFTPTRDAWTVTPTKARTNLEAVKKLTTSSTWTEINNGLTALSGTYNWGSREGFDRNLLSEIDKELKRGRLLWKEKQKKETKDTKDASLSIGAKVSIGGGIIGTIKSIRGNIASVAYKTKEGNNRQEDFHVTKLYNSAGQSFTPTQDVIGKPYEPDEIDHGGKRWIKTSEMIPFNNKPARKYKEKNGFKYITREVESGTIHA